MSVLIGLGPYVLLGLAGWWSLRRFCPELHPALRAGAGLLSGAGGAATLLFLAAFAGLPLKAATVWPLLAAGVLATLVLARRARSGPNRRPPAEEWSPAESLLLIVLVLIVAAAALKALAMPVTALDAHSYDGRARWIVAEGRLDLSVYRLYGIRGNSNLTYPPLFPLTLALPRWAGGAAGKVVDVVYFTGALLVLYGFLRRHVVRLAALLATLLAASTPEIWWHGSLALTNLPAMAFAATALFAALENRPLLAGLMLAMATGVRSDALVVAGPALLTAARPLRRTLPLFLPAIAMTLLWQIFLSARLGITNNTPLAAGLHPDQLMPVLRHLVAIPGDPAIYGWIFPLAGAAALAGSWREPLPRSLLLALLLSAAGLTLLYTALDLPLLGGVTEILTTSFKRGLFYLVPPAVALIVLTPPARRLFEGLDRWASRRPPR